MVGLATAVREMLLAMEETDAANLEPDPATLILGTGIDIIEVQRVEAACEEIRRTVPAADSCVPPNWPTASRTNPPAHFWRRDLPARKPSPRPSAPGIGAQLGWQDMEICRKESGEPYVVLHGKG